MSREVVEIVRRIYDAVARGDNVAPFELYAPDIEWDVRTSPPALLGLEPVYHGHEGVRRFWRDWLSAFERLDFELEELIDAGDRVLAVIHQRAVGRLSHIAFDDRVFAVWTLRDGKVARMRAYLDRDEALEAAGLSE
jgi:ketosteroid isomerase-like protein